MAAKGVTSLALRVSVAHSAVVFPEFLVLRAVQPYTAGVTLQARQAEFARAARLDRWSSRRSDMSKHMPWAPLLMGSALWLAVVPLAGAQNKEKVYRDLTPAQVEAILNDLTIKFVKTQPPKLPKDYDYDFERNNYKIRLTLSGGKLLWISALFPKASLEKINKWNIKATFSRAVLDRVNDREYAIVEYQLNVLGGVTDNMLRQFVRRFDNEVSSFDQFLQNN